MSINLGALPETLDLKSTKPSWFWLVILFIFIFIGIIVMMVLVRHQAIETWHVFVTLTSSINIWLLSFFLCLYCRGCAELYAAGWNALRESRESQLIQFGQKPLYVIDSQLHCGLGRHQVAVGVVEGLIHQEVNPTPYLNNPVMHTPFNFAQIQPLSFEQKVAALVTELRPTLLMLNHSVFSGIPTHVRLSFDVPISQNTVQAIWEEQVWPTGHYTTWEFVDLSQSTVFLDSWLDEPAHDDHILWCISLHLYQIPKPYSAEALTSFVALGRNLLTRESLQSYFYQNEINITMLHRTEEGGELNQVLERAKMWGALTDGSESLASLWLSQLAPQANAEILSQQVEAGLPISRCYDIESRFGIAGKCHYWVALALAIDYAPFAKGKQLVMGQQDTRFHATFITQPLLHYDKETP